jgi:hypothetical protein
MSGLQGEERKKADCKLTCPFKESKSNKDQGGRWQQVTERVWWLGRKGMKPAETKVRKEEGLAFRRHHQGDGKTKGKELVGLFARDSGSLGKWWLGVGKKGRPMGTRLATPEKKQQAPPAQRGGGFPRCARGFNPLLTCCCSPGLLGGGGAARGVLATQVFGCKW